MSNEIKYETFLEMAVAENMDRDEVYSYVSDTFKDINGIRPRWMAHDSFEDLCATAQSLGEDADKHFKEEARKVEEADKAFNEEVALMVSRGASGFDQAVEWIKQASGLGGEVDCMDAYYSLECWIMNLGVSDELQAKIQEGAK